MITVLLFALVAPLGILGSSLAEDSTPGIWVEQACPLPFGATPEYVKGPEIPNYSGLQGTRRWDCCRSTTSPWLCYANPRPSQAELTRLSMLNATYYNTKNIFEDEELFILPRMRSAVLISHDIARLTNSTVKRGALLDVGSNKGFFLEAASRVGYAPTVGLENTPRYFQHSRKYYPKHQVFDSLDDLLATNIKFDVIVAMHVVEHLIDPYGLLQALVGLMKPGAVFVGEVPNACPGTSANFVTGSTEEIKACLDMWAGQHHKTLLAPVHTMFWRPESIRFLLDALGLKPLRILPTFDNHCYKLRFEGQKPLSA